MDIQENVSGMLDLMLQPGFCVVKNEIIKINQAAAGLLLTAGTDVRTLIASGKEEYEAFQGGCLYLRLNLNGVGCGAAVVRENGTDVFLLDQMTDDRALQAMALAARGLREPLSRALIAADRLTGLSADSETGEQLARLNQGLHQLLRIVGNMSDASGWPHFPSQETREIGGIFAEIFEKARVFAEQAGITLTYDSLKQEVYTLADREQLERAVLNILSNSIKFTPKGGTIRASLTLRGRTLRLSILDSGSGIAENVRSTVFRRYLRQPGIEDSRYGLGLGMVLIRSAAAAHGGAVLIDRPEGTGTRVTLTLSVRQSPAASLRSPMLRVDYAGERDHALVELSDCLPAELYQK